MKDRSIRAKAHKQLCERILEALGDEALTAAQISERIGVPSNKFSTTLSSMAKRGELCASQGGYSDANHAPCVLWAKLSDQQVIQRCALEQCWPMHVRLPQGTPGARHVGDR